MVLVLLSDANTTILHSYPQKDKHSEAYNIHKNLTTYNQKGGLVFGEAKAS